MYVNQRIFLLRIRINIMNKLAIAILLFTITSCTSNLETNNISISSEDIELINHLFEGITEDKPGASYLVIKDGKILHQKSFGLANVEENIKATSKTNYRIASVAKQFTAMGIMILENQGKLSYDSNLTEIFPDFPEYGKNINVRHLLTHQSGLIDYYGFVDEASTKQMVDADVLEGLKKVDSTYFAPGTQYQYSNSGYALLAQIVESVSGLTFADFMKKEIFEKLDMKRTQVFELDEPIENRAYGYSIQNDSIIPNDQSLTSTVQGDGGIYSNVLDYYKWDQALYSDILLPQDKLDEAFYDYDNDKKTDEEGYGFGWTIVYKDTVKVLDHLGGTVGFGTWARRIPSLNLSIVMYENRDGNDRQLMHRVNALTSIYSDYKIPMPLEIKMKKHIDEEGVKNGIEIYDILKENELYKNDNTTLNFLGFDYYRIQEYEKAKALFLKSCQEYPDQFGGYYSLGILYKKLENWDLSILNFKKVIELGTGDEPWMLDRTKNHLSEIMGKGSAPTKE